MKICIHPILSQVGTYAIYFTKKAQVKLIPLASNPHLQFLFYFHVDKNVHIGRWG